MHVQSGLSLLLATMLASVAVALTCGLRLLRPVRSVVRIVTTPVRRMTFGILPDVFIPAIGRAESLVLFREFPLAGDSEFMATIFTRPDYRWLAEFPIRLSQFRLRYSKSVLRASCSPFEFGRSTWAGALVRAVVSTTMELRWVDVERIATGVASSIFTCLDTIRLHRSLSLRCHAGGVTAPPGFPMFTPILPLPVICKGGVS